MKFIKLKQTSFETSKNKKKCVNSKGKMHKLNLFHLPFATKGKQIFSGNWQTLVIGVCLQLK